MKIRFGFYDRHKKNWYSPTWVNHNYYNGYVENISKRDLQLKILKMSNVKNT